MTEKKFDPQKLQKLNDPKRLNDIPPGYIWDRLDMEKPDVLVEIGAGTAFFDIAFFQYAKPSKIYACDLSEVMLNWIKDNVVPTYPAIIPVKSREYAIPLDDGIADLVFMINLHHELDHPARSVEESHRIVKPGGNIFIVDWKNEDMSEGPPREIRWSPEPVRDQLVDCGFKNVRIFNELTKHFLVVGKKPKR